MQHDTWYSREYPTSCRTSSVAEGPWLSSAANRQTVYLRNTRKDMRVFACFQFTGRPAEGQELGRRQTVHRSPDASPRTSNAAQSDSLDGKARIDSGAIDVSHEPEFG